MFEPATFPLQEQLGMSLGCPEPGIGTAEVEITPALHNPNGVVHGAVLFAMVDTSMGAATMSVLEPDQACASIEVQVRFLRAVGTGRLRARTEVLRRGRRIVQLESRLHDDADRLVAFATGSFAVIPAPSG